MFPVSRRIGLCLAVSLALGLAGRGELFGMPVQRTAGLSPVRLVADGALPASNRSENPNDYVQVRDGKFVLAGRPFVIKGTNYFGSWLHHSTIDAGNGIEHATPWALFHDWDSQKVDADFRFIRSQLNATAIRVGTPADADFASLVRYHGYRPWYNPDGTITEQYKSELIQLADIAYANGIRVQFCLLWNVSGEIAKDPDAFKPGGHMDRLYSNQVRSVATALHNHPGVIGYSIGNEVLVNWPINGTQPSWFEGEAAGFMVRRLHDVRAVAPRQLLTVDEVAHAGSKLWYAPGPEFAVLSGVDLGTGGQSLRLADEVNYLGPHFYPVTLMPADLTDGFASKLEDAKQKLAIYLQAAKTVGKPVAINEFGLRISPKTLAPEHYSAIRDRLFESILSEGQRLSLQGLLAWDAIPEIALAPGHYVVRESRLNSFSPTEVDIDAQDQHSQRRLLFYQPHFNLFEWKNGGTLPSATAAAKAIASAWTGITQPSRTLQQTP